MAGEDVTTPANDRRANVERVPPDAGRRDVRTGRIDALVFLAAVWLVLASVPVAYETTGRFDMLWNDAVVGVAVGVVSMTRLVRPGTVPPTTGITCVLGGWLVLAPFVLGYGVGPADRLARWNDLAIGAAIVVLSLIAVLVTRVRPKVDVVPPQSPGLVVGAVEPAD
jgi:hypothetical protein